MLGTPDLTAWRHDPEFVDDPTPGVVLDATLVVRAVNPAFERALGLHAEQVTGRPVLEALPAPGTPGGDDGLTVLRAASEQVLDEARPVDLLLLRHDLPDPADPGCFRPRLWEPQGHPVRAGSAVVGVRWQWRELQVPEEAVARFTPLLRVLRRSMEGSDPEAEAVARAVVWALRAYAETLTEVGQLEEALASRATIDQAKGLLMAEHRCHPDKAFRLLVRLSNDTNVRLADVAAALVYHASNGPEGPA